MSTVLEPMIPLSEEQAAGGATDKAPPSLSSEQVFLELVKARMDFNRAEDLEFARLNPSF